ncbi:MAG: S-layer homology domain-containing protein, partial [Chloroflexi bacterium]|nr:S-layer homology domain-containing protein [Chloroflexota bacterium]
SATSTEAQTLTPTVTPTLTLTLTPTLTPTPIFTDVPQNHWAYSYIQALYASGITGGCAPGTGDPPGLPYYCPEDPVNRAQMAVFLLRGIHGADYQPPAASGQMFTDVPITHWAAAWIEELAREAITSGCAPGMFCPDSPVTRAQAAVLLLRAKHGVGYLPPPASGAMFTDVPITHWAAAWIEQLAREGITSGCGGSNYCPENAVNRAQMAVLLVRVGASVAPGHGGREGAAFRWRETLSSPRHWRPARRWSSRGGRQQGDRRSSLR